jgi:hypothetical protein
MGKYREVLIGYHPDTPAEVERLDLVCGYTGQTRASFCRLAVAFMDSTLVLEEISRLEAQQRGLTDAQASTRDEAMGTMAAVLVKLHPQPLVPMSAN